MAKFRRLKARLQQLSLQLKLGVASGALAFLMSTNQAGAQTVGPFNQVPRSENPIKGPLLGIGFIPAAVDLDQDGKMDIVVGNSSGGIRYFHNDGVVVNGKLVPKFNELTGSANPFNTVTVLNNASPAFADFTGDTEPDLVVAQGNGLIRFFRNDGSGTSFTEQTGPWISASKVGNPFDGFPPSPDPKIKLVDFDKNGDIDLLLGASYDSGGSGENIVLHESDGQGNFTRNTTISFPSPFEPPSPEVVDIDGDGDFDLIFGRDYYYSNNDIRFFRRNSPTTFSEESGTWNGTTGNPFDAFNFEDYSAPLLVDLDNDGDLDAVVGRNRKYGSSIYENTLAYLENTGNFNFVERNGFENPFDGVLAGEVRRPAQGASPTFIDIDNDSDLDLVLGEKYTNILSYYQFDNVTKSFNKKIGAENPFTGAALNSASSAEPYDLDEDGKIDLLVGEGFGSFFFKNNGDGTFTKQTDALNTAVGFQQQQDLVFIDVDGDLDDDVFVGTYGGGSLRFLRNNDGVFENETVTAPTPFNDAGTVFSNLQTRPTVADIDGDGINDLIFGVGNGNSSSVGTIRVFVNSGNNSFTELSGAQNPLGGIPQVIRPSPYAIDFDQDGDVDFFLGQKDGISHYIQNGNPAPVTSISSTPLAYTFGGNPVVVDVLLTISDQDNDQIGRAIVSVVNYNASEDILTFTTQSPVTGNFDTVTGVLTFTGAASTAVYESILRSVTYEYLGGDPGARTGAGKTKSVSKDISFQTFDVDKTAPATSSRTIVITSPPPPFNQPPAIASSTLNTVINNSVTIDLTTIISDPDGNLDPQSFAVIPNVPPTPTRVGNASIANSILMVDYAGTNFAGMDFVTIEACDLGGLCTSAELTIQVEGSIIIRNGISPNGDGLNDYFKIDNITTLGAQNKVKIFTRWGDKVFEIENYDNQNRRFEGKADSGKDLASGIYFYKIEFTNGQPEQSGYLTLKR